MGKIMQMVFALKKGRLTQTADNCVKVKGLNFIKNLK